jgi:hypothetical protein
MRPPVYPNRHTPDLGEYVGLQTADDVFSMARTAARRPMRPPLAGGLLKRRGGRSAGLLLTFGHRIDTSRQQLAAILVALSGLGKGHVWVDAQRHHLFRSPVAILLSPVPPRLVDQQVQAAAIGQLTGLLGGLGLADGCISQGHGGI